MTVQNYRILCNYFITLSPFRSLKRFAYDIIFIFPCHDFFFISHPSIKGFKFSVMSFMLGKNDTC